MNGRIRHRFAFSLKVRPLIRHFVYEKRKETYHADG